MNEYKKVMLVVAIAFIVTQTAQSIDLINDSLDYIFVIDNKTVLEEGKSMKLDDAASEINIDAYDIRKTDSETREVRRSRLEIKENGYGDIKLVGDGDSSWVSVKRDTDFVNQTEKLVRLDEQKTVDYREEHAMLGYLLPGGHKTIHHGDYDKYTVTLYYKKISQKVRVEDNAKDKYITMKDSEIIIEDVQ